MQTPLSLFGLLNRPAKGFIAVERPILHSEVEPNIVLRHDAPGPNVCVPGFGVASLATISPGMDQPSILSMLDILVLGLIAPSAVASYYLSNTGGQAYLASIAVLFFLLGIGVSRSAKILRKVT